jgi:hypothetical protein
MFFPLDFSIVSFPVEGCVFNHIEPRRGTLKRFKNGEKCLLNFEK